MPRTRSSTDSPHLMANGAEFMNGRRSRYSPAASRAAFGVELRLCSAAAANADAATGGSRPTGGSPAGGPSTPESIRCKLSFLASGWRSLASGSGSCRLSAWPLASLL